jgi:hypothetical protein
MKTVPITNSNGNTKQTLVDEAIDIHNALEMVKRLLAESDMTHGRNFQTVKDTSKYFQARTERAEEYKWLETKSQEYLDLAIALNEQ